MFDRKNRYKEIPSADESAGGHFPTEQSYTVFNSCDTPRWLSEIDARCKQEQSTEHTDEVK